jgi:hypothetical protein
MQQKREKHRPYMQKFIEPFLDSLNLMGNSVLNRGRQSLYSHNLLAWSTRETAVLSVCTVLPCCFYGLMIKCILSYQHHCHTLPSQGLCNIVVRISRFTK